MKKNQIISNNVFENYSITKFIILVTLMFVLLCSLLINEVNAESAPTIQNSVGIARVSTYDELVDAMRSNSIDTIILQNDIIVSPSSGVKVVRAPGSSPNRMKILDGNGFKLEINSRVGFDARTYVDTMVIRNFENIYTKSRNEDEGFFRFRTNEYDLHVENITLNKDRISDGAHLASSWESTLHLYGNIDLYSSNLAIAYYRLIHIHDNAVVNIYSGGDTFYQGKNTSSEKGMIIENNTVVNINSIGYVINNLTNGNGDFKLTVGSGSNVNLESLNNSVIYTKDSPNSKIYFGPDSNFVAKGKTNTFNLAKSTNFILAHPETVKFISTDGQIINNSGNAHQFDLYNLKMNTGNIETEEFPNARFYIKDSSIQNLISEKNSSVFPSEFNFKNMRDWSFYRGFDNPIIPDNIYDTQTIIEGYGPSNADVFIVDDNGDVLSYTKSNMSGNFVFNLDSPLEAGLNIGVYAKRTSNIDIIDEEVTIISDTSIYKVIGNRLELISVSDLVFETTEISNAPNKEIPLAQSVEVKVKNTKLSNWTLTVKAKGPLTNSGGHSLYNALYFRDNLKNDYLIENNEVKIYEHEGNDSSDSFDQNLVWNKGEGFLLKYNPINAYPNSDYKTKITWTLTEAIQ